MGEGVGVGGGGGGGICDPLSGKVYKLGVSTRC